jgi:hypothetical protein
MALLLAGPTPSEQAVDLSSAVPPSSHLLSLNITDGIATANFDAAFSAPSAPGNELARVAQVVYTLTQFPTVQRVAFQINGVTPGTFASGAVSVVRPLGRMDVLGALPAILVEDPAVGDTLHGTLHLSGMANVYEAQFHVQLVDSDGKILIDAPVRASAGTGTWGTFDVTLHFNISANTLSTLKVYDLSAKDGSPIDQVIFTLPAGP